MKTLVNMLTEKKVTLIVVFVIITIGATVTVVGIVRHQSGRTKATTVAAVKALESQESALPAGWRNLDIKNRVGLRLPQNMMRTLIARPIRTGILT